MRCRRDILAGVFGSAAALGVVTGCFTEIGNPAGTEGESAMTAHVRVEYAVPDSGSEATPDSILLTDLSLRFLGVTYQGDDSVEYALWPGRVGDTLDFVRGDTLARAKPAVTAPEKMTVRFGAVAGGASVRGVFLRADTLQAFRFAVPDSMAFSLRYDSTALEAWHTGHDYGCAFVFRARQWLALPGLDTAQAVPDGQGGTIILFETGQNDSLYQALLEGFPHAFNGPQAYAKKAAAP